MSSPALPRPAESWAAAAALAGLFAITPPALTAQSAAEGIALDRLRDSLAPVTDGGGLWRAYRALDRTPKGTSSALVELRLGFLALRLAELGGDPDASEALEHFRRATRREPGWPYGWYGLGLAETRRAAWQQGDPLELGSRVGVGLLERAARRHHRALALDPGLVPAALALADLALTLQDTALLGPARAAVRRAARGSPPSALPSDLFLAWGRLERAAGEPDSADAAFARYLEAGGSHALGLLERARTALATGHGSGERRYYQGAALDDTVAVAGYRADIAMIAADSELALFDSFRGQARAELLRRFWSDRDRYEMREEGERLREHYRRLLHARRHFPLTVSRRFYGVADAYRSGSMELDDRGMIYVRHGEPAGRLQPFVFGLMPNESWQYRRSGGDLLFHFSAGYDENGGGDLYDYRLVQSVLDLRGASGAPRDQLLSSRQSLSPLYGRMLTWGPHGTARARAQERGIGQASIEIGTSTDSYELRFARPMPALADLVAVGQSEAGGLAHLVLAVPASELRGGMPLRVRFVALAPGGRAAARVDTLLHVGAPEREAPGRYFVGRVELPLPRGDWSWRAALQQGDSTGVVLPGDTVTVAGEVPRLSLSDLALGLASASAAWHPTPTDTVLLSPFGLFPERGEIELYYEAGGAIPAAAYRHEIAVYRATGDPARADRRPVVSLAFEEPASGALVRSHRTLRLGRLRPGRYVVEVRVSGADRTEASRRRAFTVVRDR